MEDEEIPISFNRPEEVSEETEDKKPLSYIKKGSADRIFFLWGLLITFLSLHSISDLTNMVYKYPPDSSDLILYALAFLVLSCFLVLGIKLLIRGMEFYKERYAIRKSLSGLLAILLIIVTILTYAVFHIIGWIIFTIVNLLLIVSVYSEIQRLKMRNYPVKLEIALNMAFTLWLWFYWVGSV